MGAWEWPDTIVTRVLDGDTIDALVRRDLGFGGSVQFPVRLRLNRINCPKLGSSRGRRAASRTAELIGGEPVHVTTVKPYKFSGPDGSSGEYMAEVRLKDGRLLSDVLVAEELAVVWDGRGARPGDS